MAPINEDQRLQQQETNRMILNESFEAFRDGTLTSQANLNKFYTNDVVFEIDLPDRTTNPDSIGGTYTGHTEVAEYLNGFINKTKVDVDYFHIRAIIAEGDMMVATGREKFSVIATQKEYVGSFAAVFHFRDGKISRYNVFGDNGIEDAFVKS